MKKKLIIFIVASTILSTSYLWLTSPIEWEEGTFIPQSLPKAEVVTKKRITESEEMIFYSEVKAKWQTDMVAQVQGKVDFIEPRLEQGNLVKEGELLVSFQASSYRLDVEEARARLLQAEAALALAKSKMEAAKRGWKLSGNQGKPTSKMVFKEPQVAQAKADVAAATANLNNKKLLLSYTKVYAPYDAIIANRVIDPAEAIQNGQKLMTLFNAGEREVVVALTEKQWRGLPEALTLDNVSVELVNSDMPIEKTINLTGIRQSGFIDPLSRQRFIYLTVDKVVPGTFVQVIIKGKQREDVIQIPKTAMSPSGQVWYVDQLDRLANWTPKLLRSDENHLYVTSAIQQPLKVVRYSHDGLKVGALVESIEGVVQ